MKYKIFFHQGDSFDIKTKVKSGVAEVTESRLQITGDESIGISFSEIDHVEMFRLYGLSRVVKIKHSGQTLFLAVVRLNLFGLFVRVNFFRTGELYSKLRQGHEETPE